MPRRPDGASARDTHLVIRIRWVDRLVIEAAAARVGVSLSDFVRRTLLAAATGRLIPADVPDGLLVTVDDGRGAHL
jgi:uncharacterized protein (DUF1778 family)